MIFYFAGLGIDLGLGGGAGSGKGAGADNYLTSFKLIKRVFWMLFPGLIQV